VFENLRHNFALRRLQKQKRQIMAWYKNAESSLSKEQLTFEKMQSLSSDEIHEIGTINDQIARLQTSFLIDEAQRCLLPTPEFDSSAGGAWEQAATAAHYQLKEIPLAELRAAVRKEKRERWEGWRAWAALAIGLIGALIGLIAALKK
jgi:hypothetical protein